MFFVSTRNLLRGVAGALLCVVSAAAMSDASTPEAAARAVRERRIAPLQAAGINADSVDDLKKALSSDSFGVQMAAVYLLREKKATGAAPQLKAVAASASAAPLLRAHACEALAELDRNASDWKHSCSSLLAPPNDLATRLKASEALAKAGDAQGWSFIRSTLLSTDPADAMQAAMTAPAFEGLSAPDAPGNRIHLVAVAAEVFPTAAEGNQTALVAVIDRSAKPEDRAVITSLVDQTRSAYLKQSLRTIAARVGSK